MPDMFQMMQNQQGNQFNFQSPGIHSIVIKFYSYYLITFFRDTRVHYSFCVEKMHAQGQTYVNKHPKVILLTESTTPASLPENYTRTVIFVHVNTSQHQHQHNGTSSSV